jgi:hypothetical protein
VLSDLEARLQLAIESIYRIDRTAPVADFRIDSTALEAILGDGAREAHRETLVVRDEGGEVDLALYIADEVVARAHAFVSHAGRPEAMLAHLDEFCVTTEGVSHFVYLTFCGERMDRPVSAIELELQAEIDKFIVLRTLFAIPGQELIARLFDRVLFAERLSPEEQERYQLANRAGRRYARWLDRQFSRGFWGHALEDARSLYRKTMAGKMEHIDRAAA